MRYAEKLFIKTRRFFQRNCKDLHLHAIMNSIEKERIFRNIMRELHKESKGGN